MVVWNINMQCTHGTLLVTCSVLMLMYACIVPQCPHAIRCADACEATRTSTEMSTCAGTQAVQLVAVSPDSGNLELTAASIEVLSAIEEPVAVIAVAGPYRSGKSFLLNCLATVCC